MGISRRILNLIVHHHNGIRSLCCIDLKRKKFFHPLQSASTIGGGSVAGQVSTIQTPAAYAGIPRKQAEAAASMMGKFRLRKPAFIFKADEKSYDFFPLADRKLICTDQSGRAFLLDYCSRQMAMATMPNLNKPKWDPISLFVPNAAADADQSRLYVMERVPKPEAGCNTLPSDQFEAFVFSRADKSWQCQLIPPPPFVRDPKYRQQSGHNIESYAVVSDGSHICVSTNEAGTYCLDTANHTWSKVGEWMLPFYGKVEYVPELKLWFGLTGMSRHLAAADLSTIFTTDSQPQLVDEWKELNLPVQLFENNDPQLVNLGSGRFCVARFFATTETGDDFFEQSLVVLTCVEVKRAHDGNCSGSENRKGKLGITVFQPRCHMTQGIDIGPVF